MGCKLFSCAFLFECSFGFESPDSRRCPSEVAVASGEDDAEGGSQAECGEVADGGASDRNGEHAEDTKDEAETTVAQSTQSAQSAESGGKEDTVDGEVASVPRRAYNVVFFGGIYEYKERFEAESIQGGYTEGAEPRDYVRVVNVDDNVIGRKAFQGILEERVLSRVPMLLVDETGLDDDPFVSWFAGRPFVYRR